MKYLNKPAVAINGTGSSKLFFPITMCKKEHNKMFPLRKTNFFKHYEYFINDDVLYIRYGLTPLAKIINTLFFPVNAFLLGVPETYKETKELWKDKWISGDTCWKNSNTYNNVKKELESQIVPSHDREKKEDD